MQSVEEVALESLDQRLRRRACLFVLEPMDTVGWDGVVEGEGVVEVVEVVKLV